MFRLPALTGLSRYFSRWLGIHVTASHFRERCYNYIIRVVVHVWDYRVDGLNLNGLFPLLEEQQSFKGVAASIEGGVPSWTVARGGARPFLIAALWHRLQRPILVLTPSPTDARNLYTQIHNYLGSHSPLFLFPELTMLPFERSVPDQFIQGQRIQVLAGLLGITEIPGPPLVVASLASALRKLPSSAVFERHCQTIRVGGKFKLESLLLEWASLGYRWESLVEVSGTMNHRGGVLDIYPPYSSSPVRLEMWGNQVDSIRLFDPATQRSVQHLDEVVITPALECLPLLAGPSDITNCVNKLDFSRCKRTVKERMHEELERLLTTSERVQDLAFYNAFFNDYSLADYLPDRAAVIFENYGLSEAEGGRLQQRADDIRISKEDKGDLPYHFPATQLGFDEFMAGLKSRPRLMINPWADGEHNGLSFRDAPAYQGRLDHFALSLPGLLHGKNRVVVVSRHVARLAGILREVDLDVIPQPDLTEFPKPSSITMVHGSLREGFTLALDDGFLTLLTDRELLNIVKESGSRPRKSIPSRHPFSELTPGSYVVHSDHGIARFDGTSRMEVDGNEKEYLILEYAQGDRLYVPTEHLDRVSSYQGASDQVPNLTRLGTQEWARAKERVKESTQKMAEELLRIYAAREVAEGHAFASDSPWQRQLEDAFLYDETPDQSHTIAEVKADMESSRPMDRLVCGDVGYGKTEVALRAAFKAVMDNKQVAILVPTTVLAQQHYSTFTERLSPFSVRLEVLSRFRTAREQERIISGIESGVVDIVIGTHALLRQGLKFGNLGLVIIDEEQRFGVAHKERLKDLKQEVDVLTLSATPIPRTLSMGLSGIRDMSTMETPPEERLPIQSYVSEDSDEIVRETMLSELERGGQIYFVHNRIQTIGSIANKVKTLVPLAKVAVAHGKMAESKLEEVMAGFVEGKTDILVCTAIIESGLDVPGANTIIVNRADRFGLAQLYQLRGRVGRSSRRAQALFIIPKGRRMTSSAEKRIQSILEAGELGAGFRIAMRDLEIRGAGNILGPEQSGYIQAIGFELYAQLLNQTVSELQAPKKGEPDNLEQLSLVAVRVDLPLRAHLPSSYIPHLPTRLAVYQRLTRVSNKTEVEEIGSELQDRFGPPPEPVQNLLYLVHQKILAFHAGVEALIWRENELLLRLSDNVGGAYLVLQRVLGSDVRVGQTQIRFMCPTGIWMERLPEILKRLQEFREEVRKLTSSQIS